MTSPDPHADEGARAVAPASYRDRSGVITAVAAVASAALVLGVWVYAFHRETYVYARTGQDASWEMMKRGILLAGVVGIAVAAILTRILDGRDDASTRAAPSPGARERSLGKR